MIATTVYYMHTLDDKPAAFDGQMICYMRTTGQARCNVLATSLKQIRAEQKASNEYRSRRNMYLHNYDYVRIHIPKV